MHSFRNISKIIRSTVQWRPVGSQERFGGQNATGMPTISICSRVVARVIESNDVELVFGKNTLLFINNRSSPLGNQRAL